MPTLVFFMQKPSQDRQKRYLFGAPWKEGPPTTSMNALVHTASTIPPLLDDTFRYFGHLQSFRLYKRWTEPPALKNEANEEVHWILLKGPQGSPLLVANRSLLSLTPIAKCWTLQQKLTYLQRMIQKTILVSMANFLYRVDWIGLEFLYKSSVYFISRLKVVHN